jgi:hypothetical protein
MAAEHTSLPSVRQCKCKVYPGTQPVGHMNVPRAVSMIGHSEHRIHAGLHSVHNQVWIQVRQSWSLQNKGSQ